MNQPTNDPHDEQNTARLLEGLAETFPARPAPMPSLMEAARAGQRRRTRQMSTAAAVAVLVVLGGGALASQAVFGGRDSLSTDVATDARAPDDCSPTAQKTFDGSPVPQGPVYPTNANGLTYGGKSGDDVYPDLLAVVGDCSRTGYVYRDDLNEPQPWAPGAGSGEPRTVKVYTSDGVTQIDTFTTAEGRPQPDNAADSGDAPTGPGFAAVQGDWTATIAGATNPDGTSQLDTFRDIDLTVTFNDGRVLVWDGCQTWAAEFELEDGEFKTNTAFAAVTTKASNCDRPAPLPQVLENIRHITRVGEGRMHLHLGNWQIVVILERRPT